MLREGEVIERVGHMIRVVFERPEACESCGACGRQKHCTAVLLPGDAEPGDRVSVEMPDRRVIKASAIAYVLPLVMLVMGLLAGRPLLSLIHTEWDVELFSALCAGAMLMLSTLILHLLDKRLRIRSEWQPRIVSVHGMNDFTNVPPGGQ